MFARTRNFRRVDAGRRRRRRSLGLGQSEAALSSQASSLISTTHTARKAKQTGSHASSNIGPTWEPFAASFGHSQTSQRMWSPYLCQDSTRTAQER